MADEKKGFAGFDALVSDLSDLPEHAPAAAQAKSSPGSGKDAGEDVDVAPILPAKPKGKGGSREKWDGESSGKWVAAITLAVLALVSYGLISKQGLSPQPDHSAAYAPPSLTDARPSPQAQPAPPPQIVQPKPIPPPEPEETVPPVGEGQILSVSQVRYCLAQNIRIDGARSVVDDTSQADINRFNALIGDYNSRCSSFRYRKGVLESVRAEVDAQRPLLELKGSSDFLAGAKRKDPPAGQPAVPKPQAAQKPQVPPKAPSTNAASGLPANAEKNAWGGGWQCKRGFHQVRDECVPVVIPANGELDYTGHWWTCKRGFSEVRGECVRVAIPANAELDYSGHWWTCKRGFTEVRGECVRVPVPTNGELDYTGHWWTCKRGFTEVRGECVRVAIPANAELDYTGHSWNCVRGFRQVGGECVRVAIPANAELDYTGHDWVCHRGFQRVGDQCR